jgi:hypothetical protein
MRGDGLPTSASPPGCGRRGVLTLPCLLILMSYPIAMSFVAAELELAQSRQRQSGPTAGDGALCDVAASLRACCCAIDTPARCGGDEFMLILSETDLQGAEELAERIRAQINSAHERAPTKLALYGQSRRRGGWLWYRRRLRVDPARGRCSVLCQGQRTRPLQSRDSLVCASHE